MKRSLSIRHNPPAAALRIHCPEYAMEALELGLFMISAGAFAVLLFHPSSPVVQTIESSLLRRGLMGIAMGFTAIALIYSPMGQRSGAHMNPSVTIAYWRLGKIENWDAVFYIVAQFLGAIAGMAAVDLLLGEYLEHPSVRHATTQPGMLGVTAAWLGEFAISLLMMLTVLTASNRKLIAPYTGIFAGCLLAIFIVIEAPVSGTSMNPARTLGSSLSAQLWMGLWIYFSAPPLAMLLACEVYMCLHRNAQVYCAKLHHFNGSRCIFRCRFAEMCQDDDHDRASLNRLSDLKAKSVQTPSHPSMVAQPDLFCTVATSLDAANSKASAVDAGAPADPTLDASQHALYFG
jgi:aquaporin Z